MTLEIPFSTKCTVLLLFADVLGHALGVLKGKGKGVANSRQVGLPPVTTAPSANVNVLWRWNMRIKGG